MQEFLTFIESLLGHISDFLLSEPVVWFFGIFLLSAVVGLFNKLVYHH